MKEKIAEQLKATGKVRIVKTNALGIVTDDFEVPNVITTEGKKYIAAKMSGATSGTYGATMSHMAIGNSTTAEAAGQNTILGTGLTGSTLSGATTTPVTGVRKSLTVAGGTAANNQITFVGSFGSQEGVGAVTEAGIFNDALAGTMLCRTTFSAVNKEAGDTISITWVVTIS